MTTAQMGRQQYFEFWKRLSKKVSIQSTSSIKSVRGIRLTVTTQSLPLRRQGFQVHLPVRLHADRLHADRRLESWEVGK